VGGGRGTDGQRRAQSKRAALKRACGRYDNRKILLRGDGGEGREGKKESPGDKVTQVYRQLIGIQTAKVEETNKKRERGKQDWSQLGGPVPPGAELDRVPARERRGREENTKQPIKKGKGRGWEQSRSPMGEPLHQAPQGERGW